MGTNDHYTGSPQKPAIGYMKIDQMTGKLHIWDGAKFVEISAERFYGPLTEEKSDEELAAQHPGFAEVKAELEEARRRFDAFKALVK